MKSNRNLVLVVIVLLTGALLASNIVAQDGPYLQINNGDVISVTETEQPQIVVQFGAGQSFVEDAGILCVTLGEIELTGAVYPNAFASSSIAPDAPGVALPNQAVSFPSAFSFLGLADEFVDINPGQNYNVAFNVRSTGSAGGQVLCALVPGAGVAEAAVSLMLGPENLTDEAVIDLVASVALGADAVTVEIR